MDDDDHCEPPMICPLSKEPCIRAFCDDYGCADRAGVPVDENDFASGTIDLDELVLRILLT